MRHIAIVFFVVGLLLVFALGFKQALPKYNAPATHRLLITHRQGGPYHVKVLATNLLTFPVEQDGTVTIDVPRLPRGCCLDWYCFTIIDNSPENAKAILVLQNDKIIRRLSVKQIESLPLDKGGYRVIEL